MVRGEGAAARRARAAPHSCSLGAPRPGSPCAANEQARHYGVRGGQTRHSTFVRAPQGARTSLGQHPSQAFGRPSRGGLLRPMRESGPRGSAASRMAADPGVAHLRARDGFVTIKAPTVPGTGKKTPGSVPVPVPVRVCASLWTNRRQCLLKKAQSLTQGILSALFYFGKDSDNSYFAVPPLPLPVRHTYAGTSP